MFQNKLCLIFQKQIQKKDFIFKLFTLLFTLQFKFILKPKQIIFNNSKQNINKFLIFKLINLKKCR